MVVEAHRALNGAGDQFGSGIDAGGLGKDLHIQTFVAEVTEARGQCDRQINDLRRATRHKRQRFGICLRRREQDRTGGRGERHDAGEEWH